MAAPQRRPGWCAAAAGEPLDVPDLRDDFREIPDTPPQWVRPTVIVQVEHRQRLRDGLRHAALKGIRPDKRLRLVRRSAFSERRNPDLLQP